MAKYVLKLVGYQRYYRESHPILRATYWFKSVNGATRFDSFDKAGEIRFIHKDRLMIDIVQLPNE